MFSNSWLCYSNFITVPYHTSKLFQKNIFDGGEREASFQSAHQSNSDTKNDLKK
jgi:hypothetical protein